MMEQHLEEILPGFSTDWLAAGKTECPEDVNLSNRRYRVYGSIIRGEDNLGTLLAVLYFSDLTELYQIRDEYVRSRPVVCIILIDNYEELTKNLTESGISTLNAKLGDAITAWTDGYHGLLRSWSETGICSSLKSGICGRRWRISSLCWSGFTRSAIPPVCRHPFPLDWVWTG